MNQSPTMAAPGVARWLALDTSTDRMSLALGPAGGAPLAHHEAEGGPQASRVLLPTIRALLAQLDWPLASLDGIVFGRGPGSFTGLRAACAVVQGLAVAARPGGIAVLPVDSLLALAEAARLRYAPEASAVRAVAALDARMDEVYAASYEWDQARGWRTISAPRLYAPEALPVAAPGAAADAILAGNVAAVYGERLPSAWQKGARIALPDAAALLRLAAAGIATGRWVSAAGAQPLYVRDKVALTVDEQAALRAQRAAP